MHLIFSEEDGDEDTKSFYFQEDLIGIRIDQRVFLGIYTYEWSLPYTHTDTHTVWRVYVYVCLFAVYNVYAEICDLADLCVCVYLNAVLCWCDAWFHLVFVAYIRTYT